MNERKKCMACNSFLIAFNGCYLHPEKPCAGVLDCIEIEAIISDEFLNKKFLELYGKPELNDYDRLDILEEEIRKLEDLINLSKSIALESQRQTESMINQAKINDRIIVLIKRIFFKIFRREQAK